MSAPMIASACDRIAADIAAKKAEHDRLPIHWTDKRDAIMDEIDGLVDDWLEARG